MKLDIYLPHFNTQIASSQRLCSGERLYIQLNLILMKFDDSIIQVLEFAAFEYPSNNTHRLRTFRSKELAQQETLAEQKELISYLQYTTNVLEKEHEELIDSLKYAQNLQQSMLVSEEKILSNFHEAYIHYSPKQLVGGDFFWLREFHYKGESMVFFALADCTGHGVPGALLSVLGMNTLDDIFASRIHSPKAIADSMKKLIIRRLNKHLDKRLDGLDMALFCINKRTRKLTFVGAQMPLWIVRGNNLIEIPGQRVPIGFSYLNHESYCETHFTLNFGDKLLLFTDGFVDQFGGVFDKKFGKKNLRKLIDEFGAETTKTLFTKIITYFNQWKGHSEQTDDNTLILLEVFPPENKKKRGSSILT